MFPAPLEGAELGWGERSALIPRKPHNWGVRLLGVLTQGKNYMRRKVYVSHNTPFFCATSLLVGIEPTTCRLQGGRSGHLS